MQRSGSVAQQHDTQVRNNGCASFNLWHDSLLFTKYLRFVAPSLHQFIHWKLKYSNADTLWNSVYSNHRHYCFISNPKVVSNSEIKAFVIIIYSCMGFFLDLPEMIEDNVVLLYIFSFTFYFLLHPFVKVSIAAELLYTVYSKFIFLRNRTSFLICTKQTALFNGWLFSAYIVNA